MLHNDSHDQRAQPNWNEKRAMLNPRLDDVFVVIELFFNLLFSTDFQNVKKHGVKVVLHLLHFALSRLNMR